MRVLDLFAGCGGLSHGMICAGFEVVAACEIDRWAAETYSANHANVDVLDDDVRRLDNAYLRNRFRGRIEVVAGGPPCQGFSVSGRRQYGEFLSDNNLIYEFMRVVECLRPAYFLLENVAGFRSATIDGRKDAMSLVMSCARRFGYHTQAEILQAADFGVPQYRRRMFIFGSLHEVDGSPFPGPSHNSAGTNGLERHLSIMDAISDLPQIRAREGIDGAQKHVGAPKIGLQAMLRGRSTHVYNHEAMKHSRRLVERFAGIPHGGKGYDIGRSNNAIAAAAVTVYKSNNQRLIPDLPSLCITANFQSNYVHPILDRNLTAREAARIQTFPDTFVFKGRRTLMSKKLLVQEGRLAENYLSQYNQIGNAVPPLLAERIAARIKYLEQCYVVSRKAS